MSAIFGILRYDDGSAIAGRDAINSASQKATLCIDIPFRNDHHRSNWLIVAA